MEARVAEGMILVFGLPRSGTSWLGKIFDSHPGTLYRHEPDKPDNPDKHVRWADVPAILPAGSLSERRGAVEAFLEQVLAQRSPAVAGKLPDFPKSYRSPVRRLLRSTFLAAKALPPFLVEAVQVPDFVDPQGPRPRLVWKSINSVGRLGALLRVLPGARAVLIVRHPCGQIASVLRGHASGKIKDRPPGEHYRLFAMLAGTEHGRAHGLTAEEFRAMHPLERMAWRWVLFLERAMADTADLASCRWVRYEDLCEEPVQRARELFAFAGLDWHPQTERFLRESTGGGNDQYFGLKKDPRRAAGRWRCELPERDSQRILDVVARSPVGRLYLGEPERAASMDGAAPAAGRPAVALPGPLGQVPVPPS